MYNLLIVGYLFFEQAEPWDNPTVPLTQRPQRASNVRMSGKADDGEDGSTTRRSGQRDNCGATKKFSIKSMYKTSNS